VAGDSADLNLNAFSVEMTEAASNSQHRQLTAESHTKEAKRMSDAPAISLGGATAMQHKVRLEGAQCAASSEWPESCNAGIEASFGK
jgi:hypothetical protein